MLISELISKLENIKSKNGDLKVAKNRAGDTVDYVYVFGVNCILDTEYEYIGDDIVRFGIDYKELKKICQFVAKNKLLDLLYDYKEYGFVNLKLIRKNKKDIKCIEDNLHYLIVDINISDKKDFLEISEKLKNENRKDVIVNIRYRVGM